MNKRKAKTKRKAKIKEKVKHNEKTLALRKDFITSLKRHGKLGVLIHYFLPNKIEDEDSTFLRSKGYADSQRLYANDSTIVVSLSTNLCHAFESLAGRIILVRKLFEIKPLNLIDDSVFKKRDELISCFVEDEIKKRDYKYIPNEAVLSIIFGIVGICVTLPIFGVLFCKLYGLFATVIFFIVMIIGALSIPTLKE